MDEPRFYQLADDEVIQIGGSRFAGWIHRRHDDGGLVSKRLATPEFISRAERAARARALTEVPRHTNPSRDLARIFGGHNA